MQLLRIKQVQAITSLSRMTIYRLERAGHFPRRRQLGRNSVGWIDDEISQWLKSRPPVTGQLQPPSHLAAAPAAGLTRPDPSEIGKT